MKKILLLFLIVLICFVPLVNSKGSRKANKSKKHHKSEHAHKATTYNLTISHTGSGSVDVMPTKTAYNKGETITLTALTGSSIYKDWAYCRWSGDIAAAGPLSNPLNIKIYSDLNINAVFCLHPPYGPIYGPTCEPCKKKRLLGPDISELSAIGPTVNVQNMTSWCRWDLLAPDVNLWTALRHKAIADGEAGAIRVFCHGVTPAFSDKNIHDDFLYALYNDNEGEVGPLIASGRAIDYDWSKKPGIFCFDTFYSSPKIEKDKYYWIAFKTEVLLTGEIFNPGHWQSVNEFKKNGPSDSVVPLRYVCVYRALTIPSKPEDYVTGGNTTLDLPETGNWGISIWNNI